jgi:hypothetical protein
LQVESESQVAMEEDISRNSTDLATHSSKKNSGTTLHQSSVVRWLSLIALLESIKNAYPSLLVVLRRVNQAHRVHGINMDVVEKLIAFLKTWHAVLCELQTGDSPSLFLVLPCINHLRETLQSGARREKGGRAG